MAAHKPPYHRQRGLGLSFDFYSLTPQQANRMRSKRIARVVEQGLQDLRGVHVSGGIFSLDQFSFQGQVEIVVAHVVAQVSQF